MVRFKGKETKIQNHILQGSICRQTNNFCIVSTIRGQGESQNGPIYKGLHPTITGRETAQLKRSEMPKPDMWHLANYTFTEKILDLACALPPPCMWVLPV